MQGLTPNIDLIGTFNGSWADYLQPSGAYYGSSNFLLDVSAGAHLKLLSDKSPVSPFLLLKANYQKYKELNGFSVAPGAGLQFSLWNESFVLATIEYRKSLSSSLSNQLYYSVGFATGISKPKPKQIPVVVPPPPPVVEVPKRISDINDFSARRSDRTAFAVCGSDVERTGRQKAERRNRCQRTGYIQSAGPEADYTVQGMLNNINTTSRNICQIRF